MVEPLTQRAGVHPQRDQIPSMNHLETEKRKCKNLKREFLLCWVDSALTLLSLVGHGRLAEQVGC